MNEKKTMYTLLLLFALLIITPTVLITRTTTINSCNKHYQPVLEKANMPQHNNFTPNILELDNLNSTQQKITD